MKRIDGAGATVGHLWTEGNAGTGTPATTVTADWMNILQEEIASLVEYAGLTVDQTHSYAGSPANDTTQLRQAIIKVASGVAGGIASITNANSPYTALQTKKTIAVDTSGGAVTVNLPVAATYPGESWDICKTTGDANVVTVNPNGTDNILGANSAQTIDNQWTCLRFKSLGSLGWVLV